MGPRVVAWLEGTLEQDLRLTVNRTKTRVVTSERRGRVWTFWASRCATCSDRFGRDHRYLAIGPSKRALARMRERVRGLTRASAKRSLSDIIAAVNTLLRGWPAYFRYGYPR